MRENSGHWRPCRAGGEPDGKSPMQQALLRMGGGLTATSEKSVVGERLGRGAYRAMVACIRGGGYASYIAQVGVPPLPTMPGLQPNPKGGAVTTPRHEEPGRR